MPVVLSRNTVIEALEHRELMSATLRQVVTFNESESAGLVADAAGNQYGTTMVGGPQNDGQIYRISAKTHAIWTLATFNGADGSSPTSTMIFDRKGDLFGTTLFGGPTNGGTVFELLAGSNKLETLATFGADAWPESSLIFDLSGNLIGTTSGGGAHGDGAVFEITAATHKLITLDSFNGSNGKWPMGGLVMNSAGDIFGVTDLGGAANDGVVFEVSAVSHALSTLASLNNGTGGNPHDGLILNSSGFLYGTTSNGPGNGGGTIIKIDSRGGAIKVLAEFDQSINTFNLGAQPLGGLIDDAAGNLFGTTSGGGNGNGVVFELTAATDQLVSVAQFNGANGNSPDTTLIADADGNLFGTTTLGSTHGNVNNIGSEIFEITGSGFVVAKKK